MTDNKWSSLKGQNQHPWFFEAFWFSSWLLDAIFGLFNAKLKREPRLGSLLLMQLHLEKLPKVIFPISPFSISKFISKNTVKILAGFPFWELFCFPQN